jgi:hypothetical protein
VGTVVSGDRHLHEGEVARHGRHAAEVLDLQDVDQLVEIRRHAFGADLIAVEHDRHARDARLGRPADRQGLDVERAAPKDQRDAVEHAGLVFDEGTNV